MKLRTWLLFLLAAISDCRNVCADSLASTAEMRSTFLLAERYLHEGRNTEFFNLAEKLKTYPLYPYLRYQWLKNHLDDNQSLQRFLQEFPKSRYARLLQQKWLLQLGQTRQWPLFLDNYRNTDDQELQCYHTQAQWQSGARQAALSGIKKFWLSGKPQPPACETLFDLFKASEQFNTELVWQRFLAALRLNQSVSATQLVPLLPANDRNEAETWLALHRQPSRACETATWKTTSPRAGILFAHTISRWLNTDPPAALRCWEAEKHHFSIPKDIAGETEKGLALGLAFRRDDSAYAKLSQLPDKDNSTREWRVRAALNQVDWQHVKEAIADLNDDEKRQERWQYWKARALAGVDDRAAADEIYRQLAAGRSYYGFLAAGRLRQTPVLLDRPISVPPAEIEAMQQQNEFQVAAELLAIDQRQEAKRQWWYTVAGLDRHNLIVAAKLAQTWQWPAIAIFTIAKANEWDDMDLRFPLIYKNSVREYAARQKLEPAILYGLIRQESAFDEQADSPAGAKGLMQLMPRTARQIAGELQDVWRGESRLFNPELNINYGSYYYRKLLRQFKGEHPLAMAAYNAGATKVSHWRPQAAALPGDIWIETIPYKETRGYVSSVLLYTFIYQLRLQKSALKPEDILHDVQPG